MIRSDQEPVVVNLDLPQVGDLARVHGGWTGITRPSEPEEFRPVPEIRKQSASQFATADL